MSSARSRVVAWSAWSISIAACAIAVGYLIAAWGHPDPPDAFGPPVLAPAMATALATVGLVIALRRPRNPIGWIFLAAALLSGAQGVGIAYARWALIANDGVPGGGEWGAWFEEWTWVPVSASLALVAALFPDGRFLSAAWRRWMLGLTAATSVPTILFAITPELSVYGVDNPIGVGGDVGDAIAAASDVAPIVLIASLVCGAAAAIVRFRRSTGEERQQLKWLVFSAGLLAVSIVVFGAIVLTTSAPGSPEGADWAENLIAGAFLAVPISVGFGVLKYRLYDVDVVINRAVVYGALAAFISLVYVAVVIGIGTLVGVAGNAVLSALAAAVVALAFQPARRRAQHLANRLVYGRRATPYEVLSALSERFAATYSLDDSLPRLARVTREAVGATRSRVWLMREGALRVAAAWPDGTGSPEVVPVPGDDVPEVSGERLFAVRHAGALLGAISVSMPPSEPMTAPQEKLLGDVAAQAALVLRNVALIEDLRDSRKRIVSAQDERAKRLERDIHDGAQQQLVALGIQLRLVRGLVASDPQKAAATIGELEVRTQQTLDDLRDLARGIYPPLLADKGLVAALESQARKSPAAVTVDADGVGRYSQDVESAVYFSVLEALQNVAKYAGTGKANVRLDGADGRLRFEVRDEGSGFDPETTPRGAGLQNIADRLAAIGGDLDVRSSPAGGTVVAGSIPV